LGLKDFRILKAIGRYFLKSIVKIGKRLIGFLGQFLVTKWNGIQGVGHSIKVTESEIEMCLVIKVLSFLLVTKKQKISSIRFIR